VRSPYRSKDISAWQNSVSSGVPGSPTPLPAAGCQMTSAHSEGHCSSPSTVSQISRISKHGTPPSRLPAKAHKQPCQSSAISSNPLSSFHRYHTPRGRYVSRLNIVSFGTQMMQVTVPESSTVSESPLVHTSTLKNIGVQGPSHQPNEDLFIPPTPLSTSQIVPPTTDTGTSRKLYVIEQNPTHINY
jgi:hypothetical protein